MTIQQIKQNLPIREVLSHYHLSPNPNGMLPCPFHHDKKASMKIYHDTNTAYCFAGSCGVESLDVIDFIMKMDQSTKHEAILKAKTLITGHLQIPTAGSPAPLEQPADKTKTFKRYEKALSIHHGAKSYCESRALDWRLLELGYKSRKTKEAWGRGCLIFPLKNEAGDIVNFYGRSIYGDGHYYEKNRAGLYPAYPSKDTRFLLLSEGIIDAATMVGLDSVASFGLLSLFGTNGLTEEHETAIRNLTNLEEIVFALDGDEAGRQAVETHTKTLQDWCPGVKISTLVLPEGEDVNSLATSHDDKEGLFKELLDNRKTLVEKPTKKEESPKRKLEQVGRHRLRYEGLQGEYQVKGFDPLNAHQAQLDSLKITLQITKP